MAGSGQKTDNIACFLRLIQQIHLHIVPYQRLDPVFSEYTLSLAFIDAAAGYMHIVKTGDPFNDFTLHKSYSCANTTLRSTDLLSATPLTMAV